MKADLKLRKFFRLEILSTCLAILAGVQPAAASPGSMTADRPAGPAANFLTTLVERELARAPIEGPALAAVYRLQVRSLDEAATFFYSSSFLRLDLGGQRLVIEGALDRDPAFFLPQTDFLPIALRAEYRHKAEQAAQARVLRSLSGLSLDQQVRLYLPAREGMRAATAAGAQAFDREGQVRRFLRDRALRHLGAIDDAWVAAAGGPFSSAEGLVEAKVLTARNLDRAGLAPTADNVGKVWRDLEAARRELAGLEVFGGRDVIFAAGKDGEHDGPTFGKKTTLAAIAAQSPASLALFRSGDGGAQEGFERAIAEARRLTLVVETHGRADAVQFGGRSGAGKLAATELAELFARRRQNERAIVIINACFGHDFARAFADRLSQLGVEPPILIVPEEFGQATLIGRQESEFTRDELGLGRREASKLGDLWPGRHRETAVYAPIASGLAQLR